MEAHVKVSLGLRLLYLGFFNPSTNQEQRERRAVDKFIAANEGATAAVSVACSGPLAALPVIGAFPPKGPSERARRGLLTPKQEWVLLTACTLEGIVDSDQHVRKALRVLAERGFIEERGGVWFATDTGRERAAKVKP